MHDDFKLKKTLGLHGLYESISALKGLGPSVCDTGFKLRVLYNLIAIKIYTRRPIR